MMNRTTHSMWTPYQLMKLNLLSSMSVWTIASNAMWLYTPSATLWAAVFQSMPSMRQIGSAIAPMMVAPASVWLGPWRISLPFSALTIGSTSIMAWLTEKAMMLWRGLTDLANTATPRCNGVIGISVPFDGFVNTMLT